jgi:undecaprenyl-diphosphatase
MNKKNIFSNLRSPGLLGKKPIIGLMMFIIGSLVFIILAYNLVNQGPLMGWDLPIAEWFHTLALKSPAWIIDIMIASYYFGTWGIVVIAFLLALYFFYKKFWRELVMTIVSLGLSGIIFLLLSHAFMRPRPFTLFAQAIWSKSNIPGFPSGHTLSIIVCFGFLVYLLLPRIKSYLGKFLVIMPALLIVIFIGFSRLYLGDHYLTDVIAGYAAGIAWFGLTYTSVELIFKKYEKKEIRLQKNEK